MELWQFKPAEDMSSFPQGVGVSYQHNHFIYIPELQFLIGPYIHDKILVPLKSMTEVLLILMGGVISLVQLLQDQY